MNLEMEKRQSIKITLSPEDVREAVFEWIMRAIRRGDEGLPFPVDACDVSLRVSYLSEDARAINAVQVYAVLEKEQVG